VLLVILHNLLTNKIILIKKILSTGGGQYLNIYSDWEQGSGGVSTGYFLENLSQSCLSLELVTFLKFSFKA
jgi:hypothetical protein